MKILGVDVGRQYGLAIVEGNDIRTCSDKFKPTDTFLELWYKFSDLLDDENIDLVVCCEPRAGGYNRGMNGIVLHSKMIAIIQVACEELGIPIILKPDNTMRKTVFGKDIGKKAAHEKLKRPTEDESDALVAAMFGQIY